MKKVQKMIFPKDFLWGTATSSYQVEGNNSNTDWWEWEKAGKTKEKSGVACDYYKRFKTDHNFLTELNCNAYRLSFEWARIEPKEGEFSFESIQNYREILQDLKNRNIKTVVTFWHWTSPIWFQKNYGFHKKLSIEIFSKYVKKITEEMGDLIDIFVIFNEPMVPLGQGFLSGDFPPGFKNPFKFIKALDHIAASYKETYKIIHKIKPDAQVGITYLYNWYEAQGLGFLLKAINRMAKWYRIDLLGNKIKGYQDYIGIDYYRLGKIKFNWRNIKIDSKNQTYFGFTIEEDKNNLMKWIAYPEGIYKVLTEAKKKHNLPIYITENGVPTDTGLDDEARIIFIQEHLKFAHQAIAEGVDVRGYFHWSLLDNFEWLYGYQPRFGLIEIDYKTLERKPRKSFYQYAKICQENAVEIEL